MANQEHLDLLKQGVKVWNQWRKEHPKIRPDLSDAKLREANLKKADLREANLFKANLSNANLSGANLSEADLSEAFLSNADFCGANLSEADLSYANFNEADFSRTNLTHATIGWTQLDALDLTQVKGLDTIQHDGPSHISIDTIYYSEGYISEIFLRKAGVPDSFITYMRSLVVKPIDYYTCFISYSSKDQSFAERLYADLQSKGVRCWFAPHDMKIGDEIRTRIDESIRVYDKLLRVLSIHAIESSWVKHEVEATFEKEERQHAQVLFPIALDETVMHTNKAWAITIRREKHIGDFTRWKQHDDYQQALEQLLRDLKAGAQKTASQLDQ